MVKVFLFDVNETLLDLGVLDPLFERAFGNTDARQTWFANLKQSWMVGTITGRYQDFGTLADAALQVTARQARIPLRKRDREVILQALKALSAHPEVDAALAQLKQAGLRLAALTNGSLDVAHTQLRSAGLIEHFEAVFSADEIQRYKPAPEPYRMACERMGVEPADAMLIAAHAWDVVGAQAAGLATGFISRPGKVLSPVDQVPSMQANDLKVLADQILSSRPR